MDMGCGGRGRQSPGRCGDSVRVSSVATYVCVIVCACVCLGGAGGGGRLQVEIEGEAGVKHDGGEQRQDEEFALQGGPGQEGTLSRMPSRLLRAARAQRCCCVPLGAVKRGRESNEPWLGVCQQHLQVVMHAMPIVYVQAQARWAPRLLLSSLNLEKGGLLPVHGACSWTGIPKILANEEGALAAAIRQSPHHWQQWGAQGCVACPTRHARSCGSKGGACQCRCGGALVSGVLGAHARVVWTLGAARKTRAAGCAAAAWPTSNQTGRLGDKRRGRTAGPPAAAVPCGACCASPQAVPQHQP
jgi:hypothetical protein